MGTVRTYRQTIDQMDVVRVDNDLVTGLVTSVEMTLLDLAALAPKWPMLASDRDDAIQVLAAAADWELVEETAGTFRRNAALDRLRHKLAASDD